MYDLLKKYDLGLLIKQWLDQFDLSDFLANTIIFVVDTISVALVLFIVDFISRRIILGFVARVVRKTKLTWTTYFKNEGVIHNLAHLVPAIAARQLIPIIYENLGAGFHKFIITSIDIYIIILISILLSKSLKALENLSESPDTSFKYPQIRTISQVFRIIIVFVAAIIIISIFFKIKVGSLLGGLAGATALLILIFQDTINGLLANFQINMYDLFKKGDWITFSKFGVDGEVMSIDLTTVKIQNWDKTISSIPAKAFVQDSFVNWRGMQQAKARRIKRNILIDINSIKHANDIFIEKMKHIKLVNSYVSKTQKEIENYNDSIEVDNTLLVNGRRQTNIGIYRAYILAYLKNHPKVDSSMSLMVRQLQPTPEGVPLEVYCFSNDINWVNYEGIQSDIFDHLYAATEYFDLRLYQAPSGKTIEHFLDQKNS